LDARARLKRRLVVACAADTLMAMKPRSDSSTAPMPEQVPLSDEERAARLERLVERLFSPDGLDRDTLARIEQLPGDE
jgi:hypothetical protein